MSAHPTLPVPDLPELPEGVEPTPQAPHWRPWTAWVGLLAGFAGALFGALVVTVIAVAAGASFEDPPPSVSIIGTVVQDAALIGAAIVFARLAGGVRPWQFGLRPPRRFWPAVGWLLVAYLSFLALSAGWVALLGIEAQDELPKELGADESTVALIAVAFLVAVVAPVAEEFFFRGYFFTALRNWRGLWPAAVITGLVFGAIHVGSSPIGFLVPLAFFGIALCLLYARTGSLYPCIVLHCANNSIAFGVTQDWTWQIPVLLATALAAIAVALATVEVQARPRV
jgi:membrane protease YdiL (CAAX protease family)